MKQLLGPALQREGLPHALPPMPSPGLCVPFLAHPLPLPSRAGPGRQHPPRAPRSQSLLPLTLPGEGGGCSLLLRVKGPGQTISLICMAHPKMGAVFAGSQAPASFHSPWVSLGIRTQGTRVASP